MISILNSLSNMLTLQADIDNNGHIDYGEFIAAMLHLNRVQKEDHLFTAFSYFDKDGSGYITVEELEQACVKFGLDDVALHEVMDEVDKDNVIVLSFKILVFLVCDAFGIHLSSLTSSFCVSGWEDRLQ